MARPKTRTQYYPLQGGLDVVSAPLSVKPGRAIAMMNFEPWYLGGYRRIPGYERFDGRPRPSDATFVSFLVDDDFVGTVGTTAIAGDTSGTTGVLVGIGTASGGTMLIGVSYISGAGFQNGETINTGAQTIQSVPQTNVADTAANKDAWTSAAAEVYRADIDEVPGAGRVNGAWQRLDDRYAIRNNVGNTAGILHLASTAGWVTAGVTMAQYLYFNTGIAAGANVSEGDTLTGATSGATGTIHRIVLNGGSGAWDGSGEGYFVLTNVTGTFTDTEVLESPASTTVANAVGANVAFTFAPNGRYEFINYNFYGGADTFRVYGVNGVGPAFEIDENNIVSPILMPTDPVTGVAPANNKPFLVEVHRNHLFLTFEGGSVQHSIPGVPLNFSGFLGATEFGMGDDITGLKSVVGNVLVIHTRRTTKGLYGKDVSDWDLRTIAEQSGSILYSAQKIDTVYAMDDLGITNMSRTLQFGDFVSATISQQVQPIVIQQRPKFTASTIVRESNQYRTYFNDGTCLAAYVLAGNEEARFSARYNKAQYGLLKYDDPVAAIYNTEDETGKERTYFVTSNETNEGYVYEDQIGTSFDGAQITAFIRTAYTDLKAPNMRKKFRRANMEISTANTAFVLFNSDPSYSTEEISSGIANALLTDGSQVNIPPGAAFWDLDNWLDFQWGAEALSSNQVDLSGTGININFFIIALDRGAQPWVIQGITVHYDIRKIQR